MQLDGEPAVHPRMQPLIFPRRLLLLLHIHAAVGLGEKLLGVIAVIRRHGQSHAQRENILSADIEPGLPRQRTNLLNFFRCGVGGQTRCNHHKFVSAHAGHIVVLAASVL